MNISQKYYKKARRISKLLNMFPFVRCVILNGSVAKGEAKESSDIDLLIVAKEGHIFTCRFFAVGCLKLLGLKRSKDESKKHPGKFCLNYFMTEHNLTMPHNREVRINKYCASNYSYSKFLAGDTRIFKHYIQCNKGWWQKFGFIVELEKYKAKDGATLFRAIFESMLRAKNIEKFLKDIQIRSIVSDYRTNKYPDLVVYSDLELRFHLPKSP